MGSGSFDPRAEGLDNRRRGLLMTYLVKPDALAPATPGPIAPDPALPRTCVIGAGSSGITVSKALHEARVPFTCFEQGPAIGGNWVYENPNGVSACYRHLEINTSCPRMAFSDFPMPSYYPTYARHWEIRDYFERYVDHFCFRHTIAFSTTVEHVERRADGTFAVTVTDGQGTRTERFDAVIVCNGHHWDARWPEPAYPGHFDGVQLHAHDYREPDLLDGRDVLVVGMGNSAMDIAVESSYVARSTHVSIRRGQHVFRKTILGRAIDQSPLPARMPWAVKKLIFAGLGRVSGDVTAVGLPAPDHKPGEAHPVLSDRFLDRVGDGRITPKPGIAELRGDRVAFADGTEVPADVIVWCTGYRVSFPFFDPGFISAPGNELPLWKRMLHPDVPGLAFVGLLQPLGAVMPLAEAQGRWLGELLAGRYRPPAPERMRAQMRAEHERMKRRFYASAKHTMQVEFDRYLLDAERELRAGRRRAGQQGPAIVARAAAGDRAAA